MKAAKSSGNVFAEIGIGSIEAEDLAVKADLLSLVMRAMRERKLTQTQTAARCGIDQPTLSKALSGRLEASPSTASRAGCSRWDNRCGSMWRRRSAVPGEGH